jgi:hypothetical protein
MKNIVVLFAMFLIASFANAETTILQKEDFIFLLGGDSQKEVLADVPQHIGLVQQPHWLLNRADLLDCIGRLGTV